VKWNSSMAPCAGARSTACEPPAASVPALELHAILGDLVVDPAHDVESRLKRGVFQVPFGTVREDIRTDSLVLIVSHERA
jgi:hypothetical protein